MIEVSDKGEWSTQLAQAQAAGKAVIVDFSAVWCGPCQMIGPYFGKLSEEFGDKLVFLKVDVDKNSDVAAEAKISAMPTFQVWRDGKMVEEFVGAAKDKLKALVEKYASPVLA